MASNEELGFEYQNVINRAIKKALANRWTGSPYMGLSALIRHKTETDLLHGYGVWIVTVLFMPPHDFARAIWGDDWRRHVQEAVVADNPIKYLSDNLGD